MPIEWNERGEPQPFNQGVSLSDLTPAQAEFMDKEMSKSYASGMWEDAAAATHVSKAFLVKKKGEPNGRWICDFRPLNRVTIKKPIAIGQSHDKVRRLADRVWKSTFDAW